MSKFHSDLKRGLSGGDKQIKGFGDRFKAALNPTNVAKGLAGGFFASQAFSYLTDAVGAASDLNEVVSKSGEIMGQEALPGLEKWAETASDAFGQSKRQALDGAATFATFGKSADLAGDDLVDFSTEMVELASDFASFHNASPEEAIQAIGAALRGESEPIRRFGVLLNDAVLKERAFKMGLIETTSEALTPQVKVLAAQAEILEQSADAQGDFARTSDGLANSQRTLAAKLEDASASLGEKLLPLALEFVNFVTDYGIPAIEWLGENLGIVGEGLGNIGDAFGEAASDVHHFAMNFGEQGDTVHRLADEMGVDFHDLKTTISDRMVETGQSFEEVVRDMETEATVASHGITESMTEGMRATHQVMVEVGEKIKAEWEGVAATIPQEIRNRWADTRSAAFQMAVEHAKGILDGQNQVKVAFEVLTQLQEEEQTRAQRISYLKGVLSSSELAAGLNDGRPGVSGAARALRGQIEAELASLGVNAYNSGYSIGREVARGIYNSAHLADGASSYLAAKVSGYLPRSEPKEGPLRGITKVGHAIVSSITDGIHADLGKAGNAANALAGALMPAFGGPAMAYAGAIPPQAPVMAGRTYIVNVNGVQRTVKSEQEAMQALKDLGAFDSDGRL